MFDYHVQGPGLNPSTALKEGKRIRIQEIASQGGWSIPMAPALGRWRHKSQEFKIIHRYIVISKPF